MKTLASFIMRGRMQAILVTAVLSLVTILSSFQAGEVREPGLFALICGVLMAAVIALVSLRKGALEGFVILAGAGIVATVLNFILSQNTNFVVFSLVFFVIMVVPVWGLALLLRRTVSLGHVLAASVVMGMVGVAGVYAVIDNPADQWYEMLSISIGDQLNDPRFSMFDAGEVDAYLKTLAGWMTGLLVAAITSIYLASLLLARWWQALLYNPGGFKKEFYEARVGRHIGITALLVFVGALFGSGFLAEMMSNMLWLFSFIYLIPGLAIVHSMIAMVSAAKPLFIVFYLFLAVLPQIAILVALVGWVDTWFNFRAKLGSSE
ncbi:MAG: hypothetical protein GXP14_13490 [Gammaproteobacteria bacterium]|nr:hypothetical protein [Gammaproteobacteria bacterium]